ncbi:MAG: AmmeMemoRadiSam system protein B [Planctomycetia bacterium]|nr:AmmeMemoRadiSam system protein B [Planctomycetia bacterium]
MENQGPLERPGMRSVTLSPYIPPEQMNEADGEAQPPQNFLLEDPEGFAPPLVLPIPLAILVSLMDGKRTLPEIREEYIQMTHEMLKPKDLEEMVAYLDKLHYLDSPNFRNFLKNEKDSYAREKNRPATMAGGAYPKNAKELRKKIAQILEIPARIAKAEAPEKDFSAIFPEKITGAVTTHADWERGSASYGWTYHAVAEHSDADTFIIFGTSHNPMNEKFAFSSKNFDTPMGVLPVDLEFEQRVAARFQEKYSALGGEGETRESVDFFADDFVHRDEHSIEFQAIFLKYLAETKRRDIRIVPILVNTFVPLFAAQDVDYPDENDIIRLFIETLREQIQETEATEKRQFFVMASSDLAHLGPLFGAPKPVDSAQQDKIRETDTEVLETIQKMDSRKFWQTVLKTLNENKICGVAPIYCALRLQEYLGRTNGAQLLSYEQTVDEETHSCLSFASMVMK